MARLGWGERVAGGKAGEERAPYISLFLFLAISVERERDQQRALFF